MSSAASLDRARDLAGAVPDPELPMLTLGDLGVLREVAVHPDRPTVVRVVLTPTYSGCPALAAMRDDLVRVLRADGWDQVEVEVALDPPWSTDLITEAGRAALRAAGISPPARGAAGAGPVPLRLGPPRRALTCPRCDSRTVESVSEFGPTACTALYRCAACGEPFEHVKERA